MTCVIVCRRGLYTGIRPHKQLESPLSCISPLLSAATAHLAKHWTSWLLDCFPINIITFLLYLNYMILVFIIVVQVKDKPHNPQKSSRLALMVIYPKKRNFCPYLCPHCGLFNHTWSLLMISSETICRSKSKYAKICF